MHFFAHIYKCMYELLMDCYDSNSDICFGDVALISCLHLLVNIATFKRAILRVGVTLILVNLDQDRSP